MRWNKVAATADNTVLTFGTLLVAAAASAMQAENAAPPGPIEQAVIEQRCSGIRLATPAVPDPYHACLAAQLAVLRADFGSNLERLSAADRRAMDRSCSRLRALEGRERYVACLSVRLGEMHNGRAGDAPTPSLTVPLPSPVATPTAVAAVVPDAATRSGPSVLGFLLATALTVSTGGAVLYLRSRRRVTSPLACRTCGSITTSGDLCPPCRHDAAEALRRAAATRSVRSA